MLNGLSLNYMKKTLQYAFCQLVQSLKKEGKFAPNDFSYIDHAVVKFPVYFQQQLGSGIGHGL